MAQNVILILSDQQRFDSLGCNGASRAHTPNIDALAAGGLNFQNHIVANPVCSPSRGSIMTGRHITEHGLWANGCALPVTQPTIASVMGQHGFQTAHFGKLHLEPIITRTRPHAPYGFGVCEVAEGDQQLLDDEYFRWLRSQHPELFVRYLSETYEKGHSAAYTSCIPEECHHSTWVTRRSIDWLENRRDKAKPFFLSVGYFDPHHAFNPCQPYASQFDKVSFEPPHFDEHTIENKPAHYRKAFEQHRDVTRDPARMLSLQRAYAAMCSHVDKCVGDIVRVLREQDLANDTVVIFSSDHGEMLGHQGLLFKGPYMLDDLLRVPLVVSIPGRPLPGGTTVRGLTSAVDLMATVQATAGVSAIQRASGRPLVDAGLTPLPEGPHDYVLAEWEQPGQTPEGSLRCIRTATKKLVFYNNAPDTGELYDLVADPYELRNRFTDPDAASTRRELSQLISRHYLSRRPDVAHKGGW